MTPKVLVVTNSSQSGPRRLGDWLAEAGLEVDERIGEEGLPGELDGYDGLVLLGGGLMPDADDEAPWLPTERALTASALEREVPTLGICLGGQVIAKVAGGEVRAEYGTPESGAVLIETTPEGREDAVLGVLGDGAHMIENHVDQITQLPPSAVHLAASDDVANQAFRVGPRMWGLQFHPEVGAERVAQWDESALGRKGFDKAALAEAAMAVNDENTEASRKLALAFAQQVLEFARAGR
jgi:GMP synthase-like glutamine amidotransferase